MSFIIVVSVAFPCFDMFWFDYLVYKFLSLLELKGLPSPPSSRKLLNTSLEQLDFPGFCSLLHSSADLETMVIDWENHESRILLSTFTNENEDGKFHKHNCKCSLLNLKTVKLINFHGPLSKNKFVLPLVEYFLEHAAALGKLVIVARFEGCDVSWDYVEMAQEFLSFPRSSPHASVVFSHQ
ncbi:hypothetical protein K7X08_032383 [Anisodus acutangulus]|uniref:FBD domain-containing protein n=1 Tax=Anisodus acutangulus TaxID=402998 RepID=A0A9Q1LYX0_9SOLA|nr:hypothetical protein K7X08_032383 [Anisodus acutangulus]